ncbi:MAG: fumarylacetoacetate hydrolase [Porticoccaceae bacterium]|nr:fumarylacetoacetate hydrolase [Porticoccaceae bacterium]MDG2115137.1 fumarylacetoacetate hydrolase family protein [Porticoccaceae bacterium]|tara:strand:+ start:320 stop:1246 length:927 start_codon:yes stop_codon:yes gene_type:complete
MAFRLANIEGRAALVSGDAYYDLEDISNGNFSGDPMQALERLSELSALGAQLDNFEPSGQLADVELGPPIPNPKNCYAVGLNYRNHAEESNMDIPPVPMVFTKHTSCISGPTANIEMRSDYVDYEAELVAVIGKPGKDIARDDAWQHVAGLCVGQDISDRPMQFSAAPPQFNLGKSFDTFGPIGPVLTSLDSLDDYRSMEIQCDVSGELRQKDNVDDLIFDIPFIISYLSEIVTLNTGDVIFTGTPAGVGVIDGKYLRDGEILTTSIAGLGTLRNRCVRVADHSRAAIVPDAFSKLLAAAREKAGAQK